MPRMRLPAADEHYRLLNGHFSRLKGKNGQEKGMGKRTLYHNVQETGNFTLMVILFEITGNLSSIMVFNK